MDIPADTRKRIRRGRRKKWIKTKWYGCIGSRNYPWNTLDERPSAKMPGVMDVNCSQPLTELTDNEKEVRVNINKMTDSGMTYIPAGLMCGAGDWFWPKAFCEHRH